jgi:replicative DNA helicase
MDANRLWDFNAEGSLLGSMLIEPECIGKVIEVVHDTEAFFKPEHQLLFDAMLLMYVERAKIDGVTLWSFLGAKGWISKLGGFLTLEKGGEEEAALEYFKRILDAVPSCANAQYYAKLVADKWEYRKLIAVSEQVQKVLDEYEDTPTMASRIQELVLGLQPPQTTDYSRMAAKQEIDNMLSTQTIIETGFRDVDKQVAFQPGDLVIVAGRPSMGKSSLAVNMVEQMAGKGHPGLIVSLETKREMITQRIMCRRARVNRRFVQELDKPKLVKAAQEIEALPIWVADRVGGLTGVVSLIRRLKRRQNLEVVCIDYLQLMSAGRKHDNRNQEISVISRTLKQTAVEENVLMIVVSQLSRGVEQRTDKRPHLADLRDSGAIEQDADWALLLYRADYYREKDAETDKVAEVNIAKARDGETGVVEMVFFPGYTSFETLSRAEE